MRLGIDTGGTFTDFVLLEDEENNALRLRTHKVLSTPEAPERAILQGISELGLAAAVSRGEVRIVHGSTVATNAALEGKGVKTVYVANRGFADVLSIGRQTRPHLYQLQQAIPKVPVPKELCLQTGGRISAQGKTIEPLTDADILELIKQIDALRPDAVAINLLFSFLDDSGERKIAKALKQALPWLKCVCYSAAVLPEYKEYERGIATWLNASLGPHMATYLNELKNKTAPSPLAIMQSSGGTIAADQAAENAVRLLLSGPAGGLAAVNWLASICGEDHFMTFDMGGTSTDVALFDGRLNLTSEGSLGPWPVAVPMVEMHTIGAGGGSIAWLDEGGLLQVGPQSAGASPGPACYGKGGAVPTVTDANLVLGNLQTAKGLAGSLHLDLEKAELALQVVSQQLALTNIELATGIINLANEHMAQALRMISVAKGHDPRDFRLCCFGGAGGLHVCMLAEELGMTKALVPANAGVFSALGMLLAPASRQLSQSIQSTVETLNLTELNAHFARLKEAGCAQLQNEGHLLENIHFESSVDLRYQGQSATLNVLWESPELALKAFSALHLERYRFQLQSPVELVNIRVAAQVKATVRAFPQIDCGTWSKPVRFTQIEGIASNVAVFERSSLVQEQKIEGPALIIEPSATTLLTEGWQAKTDSLGNLWLNLPSP